MWFVQLLKRFRRNRNVREARKFAYCCRAGEFDTMQGFALIDNEAKNETQQRELEWCSQNFFSAWANDAVEI